MCWWDHEVKWVFTNYDNLMPYLPVTFVPQNGPWTTRLILETAHLPWILMQHLFIISTPVDLQSSSLLFQTSQVPDWQKECPEYPDSGFTGFVTKLPNFAPTLFTCYYSYIHTFWILDSPKLWSLMFAMPHVTCMKNNIMKYYRQGENAQITLANTYRESTTLVGLCPQREMKVFSLSWRKLDSLHLLAI